MEAVALLAEANAAGLTVQAEGDRLVIRSPRRCASLARSILDHKPDVMAALEARPVSAAGRAEWGDAAAAVEWFDS